MNTLRQAQGPEVPGEPLVLGIETSCDETGIGIVRGRTLLSNTIASSMDEHARYGGVVPEVAARAHLEALQPSIEAALAEASVQLSDIDAIAVTSGPGLAGALMVGVGAAKALSVSLEKPLYAVNHLVGHIAAVAGMLVHRARDRVRQQGATAHDPDPGLVAARLDTEHQRFGTAHVHTPPSASRRAQPRRSSFITTASTSSGW